MKFHRAVRPGQLIQLQAERLAQVDDLMQFAVRATVDGEAVAEGQLVLSVARDENGATLAGMKQPPSPPI